MTKLILFVGTPGAGKSTLLKLVSEKESGIRMLNLGDELLKIAKEKFGITNREDLGKMTPENTKMQRELAFKHIIEGKSDAIIDTHLTIKYGRRYLPGVTLQELSNIRIQAIIYVDAASQEIWARRHADESKVNRRNINDTVAEIDEQRSINLAILSSCALSLSIPIYIIYNGDGKLEEAAGEVEKIVESHFNEQKK